MLAGVEGRQRTVMVPNWMRALKAIRDAMPALTDRAARGPAQELDAAFERDVAERGVQDASRPVGAGGEAFVSGRR